MQCMDENEELRSRTVCLIMKVISYSGGLESGLENFKHKHSSKRK